MALALTVVALMEASVGSQVVAAARGAACSVVEMARAAAEAASIVSAKSVGLRHGGRRAALFIIQSSAAA